MQQNKPVAFTIKANGGIMSVLVTKVQIVVPGSNKSCEVNAIWDTGATGSFQPGKWEANSPLEKRKGKNSKVELSIT